MSNSWLRLWHDMPNDPKWRTISRISAQPVSLVQAVYIHLLVDASRCVTRGHVTVTAEDLASALDVTDDQVESVLSAMQGRVIDGEMLSGWEKRQPKREDAGDPESGAKSAAQRKREQREREKAEQEKIGCHDESRNVTLDKDKDKDKDTEEEKEQKPLVPSGDDTSDVGNEILDLGEPDDGAKVEILRCMQGDEPAGSYSADFERFWLEYPKRAGSNSKRAAWKKFSARVRQGVPADDLILAAKRYADEMRVKQKIGTEFVKIACTFLGPDEHWRDSLTSNVVPLNGQRSPQGFATSPGGERVYGDSKRCPPLTREGDFEYWNAIENRWEVRNTAHNDPVTGYSWDYLNSLEQA